MAIKLNSKVYLLPNIDYYGPSQVYPVKGSAYEQKGKITEVDIRKDGRNVCAVMWNSGEAGCYEGEWLQNINDKPNALLKYEALPERLGMFVGQLFTSDNGGITIMNENQSLIFINKQRYFNKIK